MAVIKALWATTKELWHPVSGRLAPIAMFFLLVVLMQEHTQILIAQELRISLVLAEKITMFTGGIYLGIYLLGEFMRAMVLTKQYRDGIAIGAVFVGLLFNSLQVAIGMVLLASIGSRAYDWLKSRQAGAVVEQA